MPTATARRCLPPSLKVMTPPPSAPPRPLDHSTLPFRESNAYRVPPMSPANTSPASVEVTPLMTGYGALNLHATLPLSALVAYTQPAQLEGGSSFPNASSGWVWSLADQGSYIRESRVFSTGCRVTVAHQSTAPV